LLDSEILAEVYIELIGGKQASLGLGVEAASGRPGLAAPVIEKPQRVRPLAPRLDEAAIQAHEAFILKSLKAPLWKGYLGIADEAAQ
jgi:DNA polymerase-3 subunit epsilon